MTQVIIVSAVAVSVIALIGFGIYWNQKLEKARTQQFRETANSMGLQFDEQSATHIVGELDSFRLFSQGHSRKFRNMIHGHANGVDMAIFEYRYTTGHGKHQTTHHQSVIYFRSPDLAAPKFELRPENFFHKIGQAFGYKDIDFDSHPEFSKSYLLRGEDESDIRRYFTPDRLDYFETSKGQCVEADMDRMVFFRQGKRIKPEQVNDLLKDGFRVFKLFEAAP